MRKSRALTMKALAFLFILTTTFLGRQLTANRLEFSTILQGSLVATFMFIKRIAGWLSSPILTLEAQFSVRPFLLTDALSSSCQLVDRIHGYWYFEPGVTLLHRSYTCEVLERRIP